MKAIFDLPERHTQVLSLLFEKINPAEYLWVLTGSACLRLQGVDVPVNDLDLQTDAASVHLLEEKLSEFMKVPVHIRETEHTLSHHGQAEINGLQVELLGDICHRRADGTWENPLDIKAERLWVEQQGFGIPVIPLAHEAAAYEKMGRSQKAKLIRAAIRKGIL